MLVSVIMRVSEKYIHNNITMLASNYLMCSVLAAICTGTWNLFPVSAEGFPFSVGLGLISGLFYMGSFMLLQWNVKTNGIVLSSMFMKLGVMVPTLMAILVFGEVPKAVQVIGMIVALAAILLINLEKGSGKAASSLGLVLLLVAGGATDAMSKVYEELGVSALKNHFLLYTFMMALALCVVVCLVKKQGVTKEDVGFGLVMRRPLLHRPARPRLPCRAALDGRNRRCQGGARCDGDRRSDQAAGEHDARRSAVSLHRGDDGAGL